MNSLCKHLLGALAALSLGGAAIGAHAQAQAPAPSASHHGPQAHDDRRGQAMQHDRRGDFAARRTAHLHDALKITPAQETAWNAFVASMKPPARAARPERTAHVHLSTPQRMAQRIDMEKKRTAAMEQRLGAVNSFYAVLTPEQKKTFDEKAARMQGRSSHHGGPRGGWGWQHHGDMARG